LGVDGYSDFNALHSNRHNAEVELIAFDVLAMDGDDLCALPLSMRKANLQRLLTRRPDGIFLAGFEHGEIGPDLFRKVCEFGLEGLVSKRSDKPYRGGRSKDWIKVKNRQHHAFERVMEHLDLCNRRCGRTMVLPNTTLKALRSSIQWEIKATAADIISPYALTRYFPLGGDAPCSFPLSLGGCRV
jgi:hypothetical protein